MRELGESIECGEADASSLREFLQRKSLHAKNQHVSCRTVCAQRENAVIGCSRFAPPLIFTPPLSNVNKKVVKPANRSAIDTGSPLAQEWDQFIYAKHLASRQMPHRQCGVCARALVHVYVRARILLTECDADSIPPAPVQPGSRTRLSIATTPHAQPREAQLSSLGQGALATVQADGAREKL